MSYTFATRPGRMIIRPVALVLTLSCSLVALAQEPATVQEPVASQEPVTSQEQEPAQQATVPQEQGLDPIELLRSAAAAVEKASEASCEIRTLSSIVAPEQEQSKKLAFRYAKKADGLFFIRPIADEMNVDTQGLTVESNGKVTLTHVLPLKKYVIEESENGFASFADSGLSQAVATGFGSVALSLLHTEGGEIMIDQVKASEYLGTEELNEVTAHHCKYTLEGDLDVHIWYSSDEEPRPLKVKPDLKFDNFQYNLSINFDNWSTEPLDATEFEISKPEGSTHVIAFQDHGNNGAHPMLGEEAPKLVLNNLAGEPVDLADHIGKDVVLLDFWATWCPPCVAAMPVIDKVAESFADRGVVFYAANQQESVEEINKFFASKEIEAPVLLDEGPLSEALKVTGLPTTIMIGKQGKVQVVHVGIDVENPTSMEEALKLFEAKLTEELEALVNDKDLSANAAAMLEEKKQRDQENLARLHKLLFD